MSERGPGSIVDVSQNTCLSQYVSRLQTFAALTSDLCKEGRLKVSPVDVLKAVLSRKEVGESRSINRNLYLAYSFTQNRQAARSFELPMEGICAVWITKAFTSIKVGL